LSGKCIPLRKINRLLRLRRVIREATAKTKDGRIDQADFLEYSQSSTRYSLFTPMEASIIFHFAGRGNGAQRLALPDFAQLLDPKWTPPTEHLTPAGPVTATTTNWMNSLAHSAWNFALGGMYLKTIPSCKI
jgi:solute carrier family 25 (mitochondrial aspartate/glutamate transporter), member 12/13